MDLMNADIYKRLTQYIKDDTMIKFYRTKEWRQLRNIAMQRDNQECQRCKRNGKHSKGETVHHMIEVKVKPTLALNLNNLETLCNTCHNIVHDKFGTIENKFTTKERW